MPSFGVTLFFESSEQLPASKRLANTGQSTFYLPVPSAATASPLGSVNAVPISVRFFLEGRLRCRSLSVTWMTIVSCGFSTF